MIAGPLCSRVFQQFSRFLDGMGAEDFGGERQVAEQRSSQYMEKIHSLLQVINIFL